MNLFETNILKKGGLFLLTLLLAVGVTSCDVTDGFDEDPNAPGDAPLGKVLNSTEVAAILFQNGNHARVTSFFTEQLNGADRQYSGQDRPGYGLTATDVSNLWITGYADAIGDLEVVKEKARDQNNQLTLGIAQAVQAMTFGTKASLHGTIPASEAVQGQDNLNPAFDSQLEVYDQFVIGQLNDAISNLNSGVGVSPGDDDEFYGGDPMKWVEAAQTLKARYVLHMAHVDQGPASDFSFQDAYNAAQNGISSNDNDLIAPHGEAVSVNANPFWQFRQERGDDLTAGGSYAARLLDPNSSMYRGNSKTDESARFDFYFMIRENGEYDMAGNGVSDAANELGDFFYSKNQDYPIVTYAENELIKAEAALHADGQTFNDALTALNNARNAIEQKIGGTYDDYVASDFQSGGMAHPGGGVSQEQALLKEILEEKYLVLISNIEAFADLRRTDNFAEVKDPSNTVLSFSGSSRAPARFPISQDEITGNENSPDPPPSLFEPTPAFDAEYPIP